HAAPDGDRERQDRPRRLAPARPDRGAVREACGAHRHRRAEPLPRRAARVARAAVAQRPALEPPLRHAGAAAAAAFPLLRERSGSRDPRLRLLGREPAPGALPARGRARVDRLRPESMRAAVAGAGAWGTAFASLLAARGHDVTLATRDPEQAREIDETGRNPRYLPEVDLSGVSATTLDDPTLAGVDPHVGPVPSPACRGVAPALPGPAPGLGLTHGPDPQSGGRLSKLVERRGFAVLSGPNFAEEIAEGLPAAAVIASENARLAEELQQAVNSMAFRVYVNDDLVGVELCAAAKNVIALAAGGVDGLRLGDNAKAALI